MSPTQDSRRLRELDGLRGLAAVVVVCTHVWNSMTMPGWLSRTPLGILDAGFEAVVLFFVLSGFVLSLPFAAGQRNKHSHFLMRRLLRLWPAYAAAVLIASLLRPLGLANSGILFVASFGMLMAGSHALTALNSPFWSLIHEARVSAIFPVLIRVSTSKAGCACVAALWLALCLFIPPLPGQLDMTVLTLPAFVAGIRLAYFPVRRRFSARTLTVIALVCVWATHTLGDHLASTVPVDVFAAVLLVRAALRAPAMLLMRVPQYLGRISYSLYLLHGPLILVVVHTHALIPVAALVSVGVADISQRFIEAPAIKLGRKLRAPVVTSAGSPVPVPVAGVQLAK